VGKLQCMYAKEPHFKTKEPDVNAKEPYIIGLPSLVSTVHDLEEELQYMYAKEPYVNAKEPYVRHSLSEKDTTGWQNCPSRIYVMYVRKRALFTYTYVTYVRYRSEKDVFGWKTNTLIVAYLSNICRQKSLIYQPKSPVYRYICNIYMSPSEKDIFVIPSLLHICIMYVGQRALFTRQRAL